MSANQKIGVGVSVGVLGGATALAAAAPSATIPDLGVDIAGLVGALATELGGPLGQAVGIGFAVMAVRIGFAFVRSFAR